MCPCGATGRMAVMEQRAREAHLTIEFEGERVTGEVRDERGAVSAFSGWLDLISTLDSLSGDVAEEPTFTPAIDTKPLNPKGDI